MTEITHSTQRERQSSGGGLGGLFADTHEPSGLVTVAVGPYVERLPLGNNTVAQIRARFAPRFDIDPRSQAVLDGHEVGDDTVVRTGQVLMFVHKSGEKGRSVYSQSTLERLREFTVGVRPSAGAAISYDRKRRKSRPADLPAFLRPRTGALRRLSVDGSTYFSDMLTYG